MKASFPPFASCFPPRSGFASPALICDQRATGARGWLRFPAYANCCLPPHPSRYRSTPSPEGEGFYCWCFSRCLAAIVNYRSQLHLFPASNYAPVARRCNRRGRAQHDHRGNIQGDGWRLRRSGHAEFSLPRGSPPSPAFQFYSSSFYVTHRFFVTFFTEESNVPPAPSSHQKSQPAVERAGQLTV